MSTAATTPSTTNDLLLLLQTAIPTITACTILDTIVQANAQGCRVAVEPHDKHFFVKRVMAHEYSAKQWNDLRRTLLYVRTEVRFYQEFIPVLGAHHLAPFCHVAECNLEGLIAEHVVAALANHEETNDTTIAPPDDLHGRGGFLVLDSMGSNKVYQESPLSTMEAKKCLETVAQLHAAAWQDTVLLERAEERLSRGSYHLSTRNPTELQDMADSWEHFVKEFCSQNQELFQKASVRNLGQRLQKMAEWVSHQLTPGPNDEYATLVHGDYKAMNVFLPKHHDPNQPAVMIDFASTGVGLGMSDVAMHIIHSVRPGTEQELVDGYLEALQHAHGEETPLLYPRQVAMRHYRLACVDYMRFVMGRFWRSATVECFDKKKNSRNVTLVNRDVEAAMYWIEQVDEYLREFEEETKAA